MSGWVVVVSTCGQKGTVGLRGEALGLPVGKEAAGEVVDQAKDLVGFASPTGLDDGLLAPRRPGVAQGAPLGKAGFVPEEQQGPLCPRPAHQSRPGLLPPDPAALLIKMIRDEAGFLVGEAQVRQQRAEIVHAIEPPELAIDQVLDQRRIPAAVA